MSQFIDIEPYKWRTIRVFISSTFRDFHAERDYLVKFVFPELRQWCERWKLHLIDIDLRWGVTKEEAENGKVLDICLKQIDGCRPFFICMLGNRYGWVSDLGKISEKTTEEFSGLRGKENHSITHLEIEHAVLEPLTSMDISENTRHAFFYFRDEKCLSQIQTVEEVTDEEFKEYQATFFELDPGNAEKLHKLKDDIVDHYTEHGRKNNYPNEIQERIYKYRPVFDATAVNPEDDKLKGRFIRKSLEDLGKRVNDDLKKSFALQFKERIAYLNGKKDEDRLLTELGLHEAFVENRIQNFIGREELLTRLKEYAESESDQILAVFGEPGSGKSSLLAKFYNEYRYDVNNNERNKDLLIIPHFVGASANSSSLYYILRRFCEEMFQYSLKSQLEKRPGETRSDINELSEVFKDFLAKADKKVLILIDGLDQLDETNSSLNLNWLPVKLSKHVKIIASSLEGKTKEALERKTNNILPVSHLTKEERFEIIKTIPSVFAKTLEHRHISILLENNATANPLYLKVALEELRVFGSFEKLEDRIKKLPENVLILFKQVLTRLENDPGTPKGLVEKLFCLLGSARHGLTENELDDLLEFDKDKTHKSILRQIRDYLQYRGELLDFYHGQFREAVNNTYRANEEACLWGHQTLTNYFENIWPKSDKHALIELPYQLYHYGLAGGDYHRLYNLVDNEVFREMLFSQFGRLEPTRESIGYAVSLASQAHDLSKVAHFTLMQVNMAKNLYRKFLYRLSETVEFSPQLARGIIGLISDPSLRRIGFVFLAWRVSKTETLLPNARMFIEEALNIQTPADISHSQALFEMTKDVYLDGIHEVAGVLSSIPHSPVRENYKRAWSGMKGPLKSLAIELIKTDSTSSNPTREEIFEFKQIQSFFIESNRLMSSGQDEKKFEENVYNRFGYSSPNIYVLRATEQICRGEVRGASILMNRGLYLSTTIAKPAIRTMSALMELLDSQGERDLVEENCSRIQTRTKSLKRWAKSKTEKNRLNDALSDLRSVVKTIRLRNFPGDTGSFDIDIDSHQDVSLINGFDSLSFISESRQLLADGNLEPIPGILRKIITGINQNHFGNDKTALLVTVCMLARVCNDQATYDLCNSQLSASDLSPDTFYLAEQDKVRRLAIFESLLNADVRCVAAVALCFRLAGLKDHLFEFSRIAGTQNADVETLDALLAEMVRVSDPTPKELRLISNEIAEVTFSLLIPRGLGWIYYPGSLLCIFWSGLVLTAIGLGSIPEFPRAVAECIVILSAGLIGGCLDLVIWWLIDFWKKPEISIKVVLTNGGSLVSFWAVAILLNNWHQADNWQPDGRTSIAFLLLLLLGFIGYRNGWSFSQLSSRFIQTGITIFILIAVVIGIVSIMFLSRIIPSSLLRGIFLGGICLFAFSLTILPKRWLVLRHFRSSITSNTK